VSDDTVERTQSATRIFRQIQALARSDYGGNTNALLVVYALEGFLRRLSTSQYADKMTLKGGMLMAAMSARRMTKDADLSTVDVGNDEAVVAAVVAEIVATKLDVDDGLAFDTDSIRTEVMREDAEYHGVRVKLIAHLVTARSRRRSTSRSATRTGRRSSSCPSCWAPARSGWRPTRRR
jgi:Nucleotidyl transferase AbiEii toxin, Type IV TA system